MNNANPNVADNVRDPEDPYVRGWNDGKKFAEDRANNIARLDAGSQEKLRVKANRSYRALLGKLAALDHAPRVKDRTNGTD